MEKLADGVWQLLPVRTAANVFLIEDVLIDAGMPWDGRRILKRLNGQRVSAHAITHAHPDHMGSSHAVCTRLGVPFWVGDRDVAWAEDPGSMAPAMTPLPRNPVSDLFMRASSGPGHTVARALREGDEVAGFSVLDTPGHTPGHIAFWRESDRVLVAGDVIFNLEYMGGRPWLTEPPGFINSDTEALRASARRIAELEPSLVLFGHGPPLRDPAKLARFAGVD